MCSTLDVDKRRLFSLLKEEVFVSIYGKDVSEAKDVDFMKSVPFFSVIAGTVDAQSRRDGEISYSCASGWIWVHKRSPKCDLCAHSPMFHSRAANTNQRIEAADIEP